jgi:HSP20 family protein
VLTIIYKRRLGMKLGIKKRDNVQGSELDIFRSNISDLFDDFFSLRPSGFFDSSWVPAIDVDEDNKGIYVRAEIPGIDEKNLEVNVENGILTIKGEKNEESRGGDDKRSLVMERRYGSFQRSLRLPDGIKADQIKAEFKNGLLMLDIPKEKTEEPKKIRINVK